jgi:ribosome biogenesis protein MAK21
LVLTLDPDGRPARLSTQPSPPPNTHSQERATKSISALLSTKPEGEARLLAALVNKLGDPSRKVASNAGYLLGQLLGTHPAMKAVVVREVRLGCGGVGRVSGQLAPAVGWAAVCAACELGAPFAHPPLQTFQPAHGRCPQIERFVFRPGLSERAHYYAAITLNQLVLSSRPEEGGGALAKKMVEIYFKWVAWWLGLACLCVCCLPLGG